jgi:hypothetical protein
MALLSAASSFLIVPLDNSHYIGNEPGERWNGGQKSKLRERVKNGIVKP